MADEIPINITQDYVLSVSVSGDNIKDLKFGKGFGNDLFWIGFDCVCGNKRAASSSLSFGQGLTCVCRKTAVEEGCALPGSADITAFSRGPIVADDSYRMLCMLSCTNLVPATFHPNNSTWVATFENGKNRTVKVYGAQEAEAGEEADEEAEEEAEAAAAVEKVPKKVSNVTMWYKFSLY